MLWSSKPLRVKETGLEGYCDITCSVEVQFVAAPETTQVERLVEQAGFDVCGGGLGMTAWGDEVDAGEGEDGAEAERSKDRWHDV